MEGRAGTISDRNVGAKLRARRVDCGLSLEALSSALSIPSATLEAWENASTRVPATDLYEAAHLLSVEFAYFFEGLEDVDGEIIKAHTPPIPRR